MKTDPLNTSWSVINQSIHQPACFNGGGSCAATVSYKLTCGGDEKKRLWTNMLPHPSGSCGSMKLFHSSVDSFQSRQFAGILTNETKNHGVQTPAFVLVQVDVISCCLTRFLRRRRVSCRVTGRGPLITDVWPVSPRDSWWRSSGSDVSLPAPPAALVQWTDPQTFSLLLSNSRLPLSASHRGF